MKRFFIFAAFAATLLSESISSSAQEASFTASFNSKMAKAGLKSEWRQGDRITIYYVDETNSVNCCQATAAADGAVVSFVPDSPISSQKYVAVYPADKICCFAGPEFFDLAYAAFDYNSITKAASFNNAQFFAAQTTGRDLVFSCVNALLRFEVDGPDMQMAEIRFGSSQYLVRLIGSGPQFVALPAVKAPDFSIRIYDAHGSRLPVFFKSARFQTARVTNFGNIQKAVTAEGKAQAAYYRLMSFNIRRGDLCGPEHLWEVRKEACLKMLEADKPDILGILDCSSAQIDDILAANPRFGAVGKSVNGDVYFHTSTSANPIFYDGSKFLLEDWGTIWLSDNPDLMSYTWGYNKACTATWARLKAKGSDRHLVYVCVHLQDDSSAIKPMYVGKEKSTGSDNRTKSVALLVSRLSSINPQGYPILLSGDLNCNFDSAELSQFYGPFSLVADNATITDKGNTYNGFKNENGTLRTDHIFSNKCKHASYVVERGKTFGVQYISDHWPVYTDFTIE